MPQRLDNLVKKKIRGRKLHLQEAGKELLRNKCLSFVFICLLYLFKDFAQGRTDELLYSHLLLEELEESCWVRAPTTVA